MGCKSRIGKRKKRRWTNGKATCAAARGFAPYCTEMLLDKGSEHVGPVTGIARVRLDEERFERGSNRRQALVIPDEVARRVGCCEHVEGAGDVNLAIEARAMVD